MTGDVRVKRFVFFTFDIERRAHRKQTRVSSGPCERLEGRITAMRLMDNISDGLSKLLATALFVIVFAG